MQLKILVILAALTTAITPTQARIGETKAQAERRWGKPDISKNFFYFYFTKEWMIVQCYGTDGTAQISAYYRKTVIPSDAAYRLDALNFPTAKNWHQVDSGADLVHQWVSEDGKAGMLDGQAVVNGSFLFCHMYFTVEGMALWKANGLLDSPAPDMEKETTNL